MNAKEMTVGLKEWSVVCDALADGTQTILLRKGGIHDKQGRFEATHGRFVLIPTYLHQKSQMLKPSRGAQLAEAACEPEQLIVRTAAEVVDVLAVPSREAMDRIRDQHIWSEALIDMRFSYKPANPLFLLIVRALRLPAGVPIANTPSLAGCRSWAQLDSAVGIDGATAVLDDDAFESRRRAILSAVSSL